MGEGGGCVRLGTGAEVLGETRFGLNFFAQLLPDATLEEVKVCFDSVAGSDDKAEFRDFIGFLCPHDGGEALREQAMNVFNVVMLDGSRPPHNPFAGQDAEVPPGPLPQLWADLGGGDVQPVLDSGAVVLLDAHHLIRLAKSRITLSARQATPTEAFMSPGQVQAAATNKFVLRVACTSHCWLQPDHPDPQGHNLRLLARSLALLVEDKGKRHFGGQWAVFLDFSCIHQCCRDSAGAPQKHTFPWLEDQKRFADGAIGRFESETALFRQALGSLGSLYSHPKTVVFMLTAFPLDYDDERLYTRSGNCAQYFERGWCFCEAAWATMVKDFDFVLDLAKDRGSASTFEDLARACAGERSPPILPSAFSEQLQRKSFSNGTTDLPRVTRLYKAAFEQRFAQTTMLNYSKLRWGAKELAAALEVVLDSGAAMGLELLVLDNNAIGPAGACSVAEALQHMPALRRLYLHNNSISQEVVVAFLAVVACGMAPQLQVLYLDHNALGVAGAQGDAVLHASHHVRALKDLASRTSSSEDVSPRAAPQLEVLTLSNCDLGPAMALAAAEAIQRLSALRVLYLEGNAIGEEAAAVLTQVLAYGATPKVQKLNLENNAIGPAGARGAAEALRQLPALRELYLMDNGIGEEGAAAIGASFATGTSPQLKVLSLGGNAIGPAGARAIVEALPRLPSLRELYILENDIGHEAAMMLAQVLASGWSRRLELLSMGQNAIGPFGASAMARALQQLPALRELHLARNGIGDEGVASLAHVFAAGAAPRLETLNLGHNALGAEGAAALAGALRAMQALRRLKLHGNALGDAAAALRTAWGARAGDLILE